MISPRFDMKSGILMVEYKGEITMKELFDAFNQVINDDSLPRKLKVLQDGYQAQFYFDPFELKKLMRVIEKNLNKYSYIRVASLNSNPRVVAYGKFFSALVRKKNFSYEIFLTEEAALNWLAKFD